VNGLHIAATGRLGGDPEQRYTGAGKPLLTFSMAVDESTTATEDQPKPEMLWLRVTCWDQLAEALAEVLQKGMPVYVEGRLKHERWQSNDGPPRCGLKVSAWRVEVHGQIGKNAPRRDGIAAAQVGSN
jgi:single-strand DNA-binding protein